MGFKELDREGLNSFIDLNHFGFNTFTLKIIAMVTMIVDHLALIFLVNHEDSYMIFRSIGRVSFPIFCFVLVEGYFYTKNKLNHAIYLGIFALISEIPYDMMYGSFFSLEHQNVIFTLFIGFLTIWSLESIAMCRINYSEKLLKFIGIGRINTILELLVMIIGLGSSYLLKVSYSFAGVLLIICFYVFKKKHFGRAFSNIVFNMGMFGVNLQWWGAMSIVPIALYNGKPGPKKLKMFFYWFYPLHITVLLALKYFI